MHVGEYILALVIIVLGLALAAMASALDRLVKRRREVKFDIATAVASAMVFYAIVANLWAQYFHYKNVTSAPLSEGVIMIVTFMITFLMAALVLPDEWEGQMDLRAHYENIRRPLWGLFGINAVAVFVANLIRSGSPHAANLISLAIGLAISATLVVVRARSVQIVVLTAVFALQVFSLGNLTISG